LIGQNRLFPIFVRPERILYVGHVAVVVVRFRNSNSVDGTFDRREGGVQNIRRWRNGIRLIRYLFAVGQNCERIKVPEEAGAIIEKNAALFYLKHFFRSLRYSSSNLMVCVSQSMSLMGGMLNLMTLELLSNDSAGLICSNI